MFTKKQSNLEKVIDTLSDAVGGKKKESLPEKAKLAVTNALANGKTKKRTTRPDEVLEVVDISKLGAVKRLGKPAAVVAATAGAGAIISAARGRSGSDADEAPEPSDSSESSRSSGSSPNDAS